MIEKFILQTFILSVAVSEWIEITKVGSKNNKSAVWSSKTGTYTVPNYEITLKNPQIYGIEWNDGQDKAAVSVSYSPNSQSRRENKSDDISEYAINESNKTSTGIENEFSIIENPKDINSSSDETVVALYPANNFETGVGSSATKANKEVTNIKNDSEKPMDDDDDHGTVAFYPANEFETTVQRSSEDSAAINVNITQNENDDVQDEDTFIEDADSDEKEDELGESEDESADKSFSGFMFIVNHVQNQLLDFKGKSFNSKVEHLKKLRDNILYEIKYRISLLFKSSEEDTRNSRMFKDDEHYMDYPSNEGALITIGFLTFAVFLIKLVLKLVHSLKFKEQYYYQTSTTPASIFLRKTQREVEEERLKESAKILRYMEEYSP